MGVLSVFMAALFTLILIILVVPESWRIGLLGGFRCFYTVRFARIWVGASCGSRTVVRLQHGRGQEDWQTLTEQVPPVQTTERRHRFGERP